MIMKVKSDIEFVIFPHNSPDNLWKLWRNMTKSKNAENSQLTAFGIF